MSRTEQQQQLSNISLTMMQDFQALFHQKNTYRLSRSVTGKVNIIITRQMDNLGCNTFSFIMVGKKMVSKSLEGLFDGYCVMSSPSWRGHHGTNIVSRLYVWCGGQRELECNKYKQNPSKSLQN